MFSTVQGFSAKKDTIPTLLYECFQLAQDTLSTVIALHIVLNVSVLVSLMTQLVDPGRTVSVVFAIVFTVFTMLISTGFVMWNGGDVTVVAATLATDMYGSGWQNCSVRADNVRRMLAISMAQAQKPVEIKAFGVITVSYESYLTIVRSSYSIFTVLY